MHSLAKQCINCSEVVRSVCFSLITNVFVRGVMSFLCFILFWYLHGLSRPCDILTSRVWSWNLLVVERGGGISRCTQARASVIWLLYFPAGRNVVV